MKQILTYISPINKELNDEHKMAVKIQIDNSIELGWKRDDILLVTNFEYEYNGVKSIVIGDENYCSFHWPATKIYTIVKLFESGLIGDELYWYHDFDCFQLTQFTEADPIGMGSADMALTNYGRMPRLCSASIFFKKSAKDIFVDLKRLIDKIKWGEEPCIARLINTNKELKTRVKLLNITYAFHKFNLLHCYNEAIKPIRAAHFHLTPDKYDFYVRGNNKLSMPLISSSLISIFHKHGFNE